MNNISNISSYISNCSNVSVMNELLNCIDTGVSYVRQENIERLLIENQIITLEQNNSLERIEENTRT
jgi:transcriptional regulator CtsR